MGNTAESRITEAWSVGQRGRYTGEHKPGAPTKQRLEIRGEKEISNAITTIQKDFYILVAMEVETYEDEN